MKNIYEVIRQKEIEIQQLQKDIDALRTAARLLADDGEDIQAKTMASSAPVSRSTPVSASVKTADSFPAAGIRQFP